MNSVFTNASGLLMVICCILGVLASLLGDGEKSLSFWLLAIFSQGLFLDGTK